MIGLLNLIIAFITPYWVISWPRVYSPFRKVGLWEACFAGQILDRDPLQKSYHGCWWILAPELYDIRDWIMPPWFVVVQILITISLVIEFVALIFNIRVWLHTSGHDKSGLGRRRAPFNIVQAMTYITIITTVLKAIAVIMFGLGFKYDWFWLPNPEINYPHFSYGLAILSTFFSFFSAIAHVQFRNIVQEEYHQPAHLTAIPPPVMYKM
jgi:hypothetical protein